MSFVKWLDEAPWWAKILLAFPVLGIVWGVYRVIKGCNSNNWVLIVAGILWIVPFFFITWLIDLVCIIAYKEPKLFV